MYIFLDLFLFFCTRYKQSIRPMFEPLTAHEWPDLQRLRGAAALQRPLRRWRERWGLTGRAPGPETCQRPLGRRGPPLLEALNNHWNRRPSTALGLVSFSWRYAFVALLLLRIISRGLKTGCGWSRQDVARHSHWLHSCAKVLVRTPHQQQPIKTNEDHRKVLLLII